MPLHRPVALLLGKLHVALVLALVGRVEDYLLDESSPEAIDTRREPYLGTGGNRRLVA